MAGWLGPETLLDLGLRFGPYGGGWNPLSGGLSLRKLKAAPHGLDLGPYDRDRLTYDWSSPDPRVDELQAELASLVERSVARGDSLEAAFLDVNAAVHAAAGARPPAVAINAGSIEGRPRLTEPWFC